MYELWVLEGSFSMKSNIMIRIQSRSRGQSEMIFLLVLVIVGIVAFHYFRQSPEGKKLFSQIKAGQEHQQRQEEQSNQRNHDLEALRSAEVPLPARIDKPQIWYYLDAWNRPTHVALRCVVLDASGKQVTFTGTASGKSALASGEYGILEGFQRSSD
jgi:hypothetical protein